MYYVFIIAMGLVLYSLIIKVFFKRMNDYLIFNKKTKAIHQCVSLKRLLKNNSRNNYNGKNVKARCKREVLISADQIKEYFYNSKHKNFTVYTNKDIRGILLKLEEDNIIKLQIINSNKESKKRQIYEKLIFMGIITTLKNLFNIKNYWCSYIFKEEAMITYSIQVLV
ncbi:hypothetical protein [Clostridium sp.]|uniref:hypothetical protein n=1 Tax=Clostridium sp. TaxID=1506 RepID=UPI00284AD23C|nr:hypothetical protein [Clostridium sp.]MDR3593363.1 hypothetical protein [Clostridium sp.]